MSFKSVAAMPRCWVWSLAVTNINQSIVILSNECSNNKDNMHLLLLLLLVYVTAKCYYCCSTMRVKRMHLQLRAPYSFKTSTCGMASNLFVKYNQCNTFKLIYHLEGVFIYF